MSLSMLTPFAKTYIVVVTFIFALVMGSALNCLAYRYSHGLKWSGGRSVCTKCGHVLSSLDLIPLFSWLFLKGRCRYCGEKISIRYPLTELTLGVSYVAVLLRYDLTVEALVIIVLVSCLFCLSLIDMETLTIPDRFLVIPAVFRLAELFYRGGLANVWYGIWHALILGGFVLLLSVVMDKLLHKESMGGGDIKLLFVLGLFFDLPCCFLLLIFACIIGIICAAVIMRLDRGTAFPFGPSISASALITLLIGEQLSNWYLSLF